MNISLSHSLHVLSVRGCYAVCLNVCKKRVDPLGSSSLSLAHFGVVGIQHARDLFTHAESLPLILIPEKCDTIFSAIPKVSHF